MLGNKSLVAFDIGSSAIKAVELTGSSVGKSEKKLSKIGIEYLPQGVVVDGTVQDATIVVQTIKKMMGTLKIPKNKRVSLCVNGSSVLVKKISVDVTKDSSFEEQVFYQAEQAFQIDLSELYFDSVKSNPSQTDGKIDAVIVGARRDLIDTFISTIKSAGLLAGSVECGILSTYNMFEYNYGAIEGLVAVLNFGASSCQISLLQDGKFLFSREIHLGGEAYTRRIMETANLNYETAESLKVSFSDTGTPIPQNIQQALAQITEAVVSEIKNTIDYFLNSSEAPVNTTGLNYVFLSGGAAKTAGLSNSIAQSLGVTCHFINPFQRMSVDPKKFGVEYLGSQGVVFASAIGLAMRSRDDTN